MFYPWNWSDQKRVDPVTKGMQGAKYYNDYIIPDDHCDENSGVPCSPVMYQGRDTDWFTNYTWIPDADESAPFFERTPYFAPGTAPIWGEGCGANGGNPQGCNAGDEDSSPYGTCCGGRCGGYVGGRSAMEHAAEGTFDSAPVTTWERGTIQNVYWASGAKHRGVYAYRLCKVLRIKLKYILMLVKDFFIGFRFRQVEFHKLPRPAFKMAI